MNKRTLSLIQDPRQSYLRFCRRNYRAEIALWTESAVCWIARGDAGYAAGAWAQVAALTRGLAAVEAELR